MRLLEQIGSYAGLAAIPGLAVLSALYFSQARDVKRLREWAGRAPERAAEQAGGGRVAAVQAATATPAAATPAAATPAAATTAPAPAPATPVADTATPEEASPAPAGEEQSAEAQPAAAAASAITSAKPATAAGAASATGNGSSSSVRPGPPPIGAAAPRRTIPRVPSSQTSVLTPQAKAPDPWYRRLTASLPAARYIALIVAGVLVLGGGAVFGISQLANDEPSSSSGSSNGSASGGDPAARDSDPKDGDTAALSPSDVTVTVVNGTSVANLARDTADELSQQGFQIGNKVTGTGSLAVAESVVQYKPGANAEARLVADKLNISQKEPADGDAIAQAGPASVIVVLGADQAPGG